MKKGETLWKRKLSRGKKARRKYRALAEAKKASSEGAEEAEEGQEGDEGSKESNDRDIEAGQNIQEYEQVLKKDIKEGG
jgi:hypothetical protein